MAITMTLEQAAVIGIRGFVLQRDLSVVMACYDNGRTEGGMVEVIGADETRAIVRRAGSLDTYRVHPSHLTIDDKTEAHLILALVWADAAETMAANIAYEAKYGRVRRSAGGRFQ